MLRGFFFSSRRRHTRFSRDWSSDVCSSDLERKPSLSIQEREVKLEVEQMPLIGNTVRLKAEFKDFNGEYVSPENVILRIYDGYRSEERRVGKESRSPRVAEHGHTGKTRADG